MKYVVNVGILYYYIRGGIIRDRNLNDKFLQKRGDTHVGSIEEKYGLDFGVRSDKSSYIKKVSGWQISCSNIKRLQ